MTVGELKEILAKYDDDLLVVTGGFDEYGYENIGDRGIIKIKSQKTWGGSYVGPDEQVWKGGKWVVDKKGAFEALLLNFI